TYSPTKAATGFRSGCDHGETLSMKFEHQPIFCPSYLKAIVKVSGLKTHQYFSARKSAITSSARHWFPAYTFAIFPSGEMIAVTSECTICSDFASYCKPKNFAIEFTSSAVPEANSQCSNFSSEYFSV